MQYNVKSHPLCNDVTVLPSFVRLNHILYNVPSYVCDAFGYLSLVDEYFHCLYILDTMDNGTVNPCLCGYLFENFLHFRTFDVIVCKETVFAWHNNDSFCPGKYCQGQLSHKTIQLPLNQ